MRSMLSGARAALLQAFGERRQKGLGVELGRLAAGADEAVAQPSGEPGRRWTGGCDVDRHRGLGAVVDGGALGAIVLALEGDALLARQTSHQLDRLGKTSEAFLERRPRHARRRHLVQGFAGADAEEHAARIKTAQRPHRLRHDRRMVPKRRGYNARADGGAGGALAERAEPSEGKGPVPAGVPPGLEMIAHHDRVEADGFGVNGEIEELPRRELLCRSLVAEFQHLPSFRELVPAPEMGCTPARAGRLDTRRPVRAASVPILRHRQTTSKGRAHAPINA